MTWTDSHNELPLSGIVVLAKKTEHDNPVTVPSDHVRSHLSQYRFWKTKISH